MITPGRAKLSILIANNGYFIYDQNTCGTIAVWGGAKSSGRPFYGKMCYPTFVVWSLMDNIIYPTSNHMEPLDFKWLLTGPLQSRGTVKLHLTDKGYLGFVVG